MRLGLLTLALLGACAAQAQVTATITAPQNAEAVGKTYNAQGAVASSAGNITAVAYSLDGTAYTPVGAMLGSPPSAWLTQLSAQSMTPGAHTLQIRATDALSNVGFSTVRNFTTFQTTPVCSHTLVGGSIFCERTAYAGLVSGTTTNVALTGGYTAGQTIFAFVFTALPVLKQGGLTSNITSGALTFDVNDQSCNGPCSWPSPPFYLYIDSEKLHVTNITGSGPWHFTVDARGVAGSDCIPPGNYPNNVANMGLVNGGLPQACSSAASHLANVITNTWPTNIIPANAISNTNGYTWTFFGSTTTGPLGDFSGFPIALWYTTVPTTTAGTDTISVSIPTVTNNFIQVYTTVYSGVGSVEPTSGIQGGFGGPVSAGDASSGTYATTVGDLNISFVAGAPTRPIGTGWNERIEDASRPYVMSADQYATSATTSSVYNMNTEGYLEFGLAFKPVGASVAGKSVVLSTQTVLNNSIPGCASNANCTFEWSFHGWGSPTLFEHPVQPFAADLNVYWVVVGATPTLLLTSLHETGSTDCQVPLTGKNLVTIRWQRVAATASTGTNICQATDELGNTYLNQTTTYSGISGVVTNNGVTLGGTTATLDTAYIRIFSSNFASTATPPTTAQDQTNCAFQWKFDLGNNTPSLTDSTGNGYTGVLSSGAITDPGQTTDTPYQNLVVALPRTSNAPTWNTWISFKLNATGVLDGSTSYSQTNASATVTPTWTNASGPITPSITSPSSLTTNVTGLTTFGYYCFNLLATDAASNTANTQLCVGAVDYNTNGVVQQSAAIGKVYGPQIAFGQNPWAYMDERSWTATTEQIASNPYFSQGTQWATPASGTVTYPFSGIGPSPSAGCYGVPVQGGTSATLNGAITATATSIAIHHAECLSGLASLPTWILIGNTIDVQEAVRVTAATAVTGDATLTVGYDGRGLAGAIWQNFPFGTNPVIPAQAWGSATVVGEMRLAGSGTQFSTDSVRPLCPAGVPGPPGPVTYSTGTVSGVGSSTTLTGTGTSWTQNAGTTNTNVVFLTDFGHNTITQQYIRVTGTHGGGTPFVFWAFVNSVAVGNGSIMISRPLPSDFDSGNFSYKLTGVRFGSLEYVQNAHTYRALQQLVGCESNTAAFAVITHDITTLDTTIQSAVSFSYKDILNAQGPSGPNFYGTGFAERAFYYRSGYLPALTAANLIDDYWVRDPELCGGCGGIPLLQGGGVLGGITDMALNASTLLTWLDVTPFAATGASDAPRSCNYDDPRDQGYVQAWLALVALFDPDATRQIAWNTGLTNWVTRDQTCRRNAADGYATGFVPANPPNVYTNSWAGSSLWAANSPLLTLTNGSATGSTAIGSTLSSNINNSQITFNVASTTSFPAAPFYLYIDSEAVQILSIVNPITVNRGQLGTVAASHLLGAPIGPLTAATCAGQDDGSGTIQVVNGNTSATIIAQPGSGNLIAGYRLTITDTSGTSIPYTFSYNVSGTSVTLAGAWPGVSGTYHFMSEGGSLGGFMTAIGSSNLDWPDVSVATGLANNTTLQKTWACKYVNPTALLLNRAWDGTTGSAYSAFSYVVAGFQVQEFMKGVKATAMNWASQYLANSAVVSAYTMMSAQNGTWMATYGVDLNSPGTLGTYYDRVFGNCEPAGVPNGITLFDGIHELATSANPACGFMGLNAGLGGGVGEFTARVNTAEAYSALAAYYNAQCLLGTAQCNAARAFVDTYYGAIYGNCSLTSGGGATYYCDSHYINTANELSNASLGGAKWSGFFFGVGFGAQWPALRLSGLASIPQTLSLQGPVHFNGQVGLH